MKAGEDSRGDAGGRGEFPIQIQERLWVNSKMSLTSVGCTLSSIIFPPSRLRRSVTIFCWIATLPLANLKRSQENTCPNRRRQSGMRQSMTLRPKNKFACLPSIVSQKFRSVQRVDALEASDATGVSCAVARKLIQDTRLRAGRHPASRRCGHDSSLRNKKSPQKNPTSFPDVRRP
jgi:hypothetical protein